METGSLIGLIQARRADRNGRRISVWSSECLAELVRALVAAIDARDPFNASHSRRVTRLALRLGLALSLPPQQLEILELAALLHDVGKLGVPAEILSKPGPLDESEWQIVRRHPALGAQILETVEPLREVARIVRHHHERVDGCGYPDGLVGETIPALARLICIVDAYEAMTADRAYRRAMDRCRARKLIRAGLGAQFDPAMGEVFLALPDLP